MRIKVLSTVISIVVGAAAVIPASAQVRQGTPTQRQSAMTCDYYKKQLLENLAKSRKANAPDPWSVRKAPKPEDQPAQDVKPAGKVPDFTKVEDARRKGDLACARHEYVQGVMEYKKGLAELGVPVDWR